MVKRGSTMEQASPSREMYVSNSLCSLGSNCASLIRPPQALNIPSKCVITTYYAGITPDPTLR